MATSKKIVSEEKQFNADEMIAKQEARRLASKKRGTRSNKVDHHAAPAVDVVLSPVPDTTLGNAFAAVVGIDEVKEIQEEASNIEITEGVNPIEPEEKTVIKSDADGYTVPPTCEKFDMIASILDDTKDLLEKEAAWSNQYAVSRKVYFKWFKSEAALSNTKNNLIVEMRIARDMLQKRVSILSDHGISVDKEIKLNLAKLDPNTAQGKEFIQVELVPWELALEEIAGIYTCNDAYQDAEGNWMSHKDVVEEVWKNWEEDHSGDVNLTIRHHPDSPLGKRERNK